MENPKVIPINKKLFPDKLRNDFGESLEGYLKSPQNDKDKVVDEIEQVICTSIVVAAKNVGMKLANSLLDKIFGPDEKQPDVEPTPAPEPVPPEDVTPGP